MELRYFIVRPCQIVHPIPHILQINSILGLGMLRVYSSFDIIQKDVVIQRAESIGIVIMNVMNCIVQLTFCIRY